MIGGIVLQNFIIKVKDKIELMKISGKTDYLKRKLPSWAWSIIRFLFLAGISFVVLYPIIFSLSMSFRTIEDVGDPAVIWIPKHLTFDKFLLWPLFPTHEQYVLLATKTP